MPDALGPEFLRRGRTGHKGVDRALSEELRHLAWGMRDPVDVLVERLQHKLGRPLARANATPGPDLNGAFTDIAGALQQMLR